MAMDIPLYEQIYKDLLEKITEGEFKYGDRVPSEKELAKKFNVSRITSKKALDILAEYKVIERIRGKGSFVLNNQPNMLLNEHSQENDLTKIKSLSIGLILPDFSTNFGLVFLKHVEKLCSELSIHLLIKRSYGLVEEEAKSITSMVELGIDGLLIIPVHGQHYNNTLLQLVLNKFPIVLADRFLKGIPASSVCIDNRRASKQLTEHLISAGHTNIAYLSPPLTGTSAIEERLEGYKSAFSYQGLRLNRNHIFTDLTSSLPASIHSKKNNKLQIEDCNKIENFILNNPEITSFVVCEYALAALLYNVLKKINKKVPEDYSIACFDFPTSELSDFQFTHIKQNEQMLANKGIDLLCSQINGNDVPKQKFTKYQLIKGNTTR